MQHSLLSRTGILLAAVMTAAVGQATSGQAAPAQEPESKATLAHEAKGIPARATPGDYQTHAQAGALTIAGDFTGHSVATPDGVYSTEDYVAIEVAMFGPPQAHGKLSFQDFSLRINGKKVPIQAQSVEAVLRSLKDPMWAPPETDAKSKSSFSTGGGGGDNTPPPPAHMPFDLQRTMDVRVLKAALPEGDRVLPQGGLIFFQYHGKEKSIHTVELVYAGAAGNAVLRFEQ